ncbi:MAG: hypothetical protein R6W88_16565, partial [Desulfobacterales bacterium]
PLSYASRIKQPYFQQVRPVVNYLISKQFLNVCRANAYFYISNSRDRWQASRKGFLRKLAYA